MCPAKGRQGCSPPEGPMALSLLCRTSTLEYLVNSCACAEMILPSWFVGLLEKPALLGPHQQRVSQGRTPRPGALGRHECRCCRMRRCPACTRNRAGLVSPRRGERDVLHPHMTEGFFCGRAFPLTCCCSHRKGEMCVRERVERVSEQMALIGRGMDFYFCFFFPVLSLY